jgi:SAM-dependent methyltransferase
VIGEAGSAPSDKTLLAVALNGRVRLGSSEAAVFETFVVPRYMSMFGEIALEMLVESEEAQVVHLDCRTGYPDGAIAAKLPGAYLVGVDGSVAALELARAKAATIPDVVSQYRLVTEWPVPLPDAAFSHALLLHASGDASDRGQVIGECARLLAANGQAVVAMPTRGSFQEIGDLLREFALKTDDAALGDAVDSAEAGRPTIEAFGAELAIAGFDFVEVALREEVLRFPSGRDFFEDPLARLVILPEMRFQLNLENRPGPLDYVREAIDAYWSEGDFELTVNVGCTTGRKVA